MDHFRNKRILITGATGLLGSHLVNFFLSAGCSLIYAMGRSEEKLNRTFPRHKNITFVEHDIATNPIPEGLGHLDYIFHAASPISGVKIKTHPVDVIRANLTGLFNCLEYLRKQNNGRIVVFSSATVYSHSVGTAVREDQTEMSVSLESLNAPYAESKRMIEVIARSYWHQYGVEFLLLRFSYLYGYSKNAANTAFYDLVSMALRGEDLTIHNPSLPRRDNLYIDDALNAIVLLCREGRWNETYNVSSAGDRGNYASIDQIAEVIVGCANTLNSTDISVRYSSGSDGSHPDGVLLDNRKLKKLGWQVKTGLEEGILETLINYKNYEPS